MSKVTFDDDEKFYSSVDIAKEIGVSTATAYQWLQRNMKELGINSTITIKYGSKQRTIELWTEEAYKVAVNKYKEIRERKGYAKNDSA